MMSTNTNAQEWIDTSLYPFQHKMIDLKAGKMHYVDEGEGEIILFIHGTPTWSFLYRDFVKELSSNYRCIAIDHLGFGLSEKPSNFPGSPEDHAKNLSEFINQLDLKNITMVVHDFGGPIGLAAGIMNSTRIDKIVLFNSWLWSTKEREDAKKIDKTVNSSLGSFLYLNLNFSPKFLLKKGFHNKKNLSKKIHNHYLQPFPNKNSRYGLLNLAKALVGASDWYQIQWEQLDSLANKEWLVIWGTEDEFIKREELLKWKNRLPNASIQELKCGHFVQEEKTQESIAYIRQFMKK